MKTLFETLPLQTTVISPSSSSSFTTLSLDIIYTHILTRLDGESLLALSKVSSELGHLCGDEKLWRKICTSKWPSLLDPIASNFISTYPGGYCSFYSHLNNYPSPSLSEELIIAVDLYFEQEPAFFSKVERIELNNTTEYKRVIELDHPSISSIQTDQALKEKIRLSWIIMDPSKKRVVNLSSREAKMDTGGWVDV